MNGEAPHQVIRGCIKSHLTAENRRVGAKVRKVKVLYLCPLRFFAIFFATLCG